MLDKSLHPPVNTWRDPEVEDFLSRHLDDIAEAMKEPPIVHTCRYPPGKRMWRFSWKWPFVHTWISKAICCCEINAIMDRRVARAQRESDSIIADIVRILNALPD